MHQEYFKREHPARYGSLVLAGKLWRYLTDLNEQAEKRLDLIVEQMKAAEGVTEELKAQNQLEWVGRMDDRKLNVYNGRGALKKSPPQILLQGNWLEQVGFRGIMLMAK